MGYIVHIEVEVPGVGILYILSQFFTRLWLVAKCVRICLLPINL